jgi:plasmid rolling circle replication initiator protein Rep
MIDVSIDTQTVEEVKRELINKLKSKIQQTQIETVCREKYDIESIDGCECTDGDIVIENNQVAFKLDYEVRFPVSILINIGENNATKSSEDGNDISSKFDHDLEEIELQAIDEITDEELPDIDFKD